MTAVARVVLLTWQQRQSYALSAINIDSDKSLKEQGDLASAESIKSPRESARLIEIYVDNIERAINTRTARNYINLLVTAAQRIGPLCLSLSLRRARFLFSLSSFLSSHLAHAAERRSKLCATR